MAIVNVTILKHVHFNVIRPHKVQTHLDLILPRTCTVGIQSNHSCLHFDKLGEGYSVISDRESV